MAFAGVKNMTIPCELHAEEKTFLSGRNYSFTAKFWAFSKAAIPWGFQLSTSEFLVQQRKTGAIVTKVD